MINFTRFFVRFNQNFFQCIVKNCPIHNDVFSIAAFRIHLCHFNARKTGSLQDDKRVINFITLIRPLAADNFQAHASASLEV